MFDFCREATPRSLRLSGTKSQLELWPTHRRHIVRRQKKATFRWLCGNRGCKGRLLVACVRPSFRRPALRSRRGGQARICSCIGLPGIALPISSEFLGNVPLAIQSAVASRYRGRFCLLHPPPPILAKARTFIRRAVADRMSVGNEAFASRSNIRRFGKSQNRLRFANCRQNSGCRLLSSFPALLQVESEVPKAIVAQTCANGPQPTVIAMTVARACCHAPVRGV